MQCARALVPERVHMWMFGLLRVRLINEYAQPDKEDEDDKPKGFGKACKVSSSGCTYGYAIAKIVVFLVLLLFFRQYLALPRM
jgi:hypothetical protein